MKRSGGNPKQKPDFRLNQTSNNMRPLVDTSLAAVRFCSAAVMEAPCMPADFIESEAKALWLKRVLGIDLAEAAESTATAPTEAGLRGGLNALGIQIRDHKDNKQIAALATKLRTGIEALKAGNLSQAAISVEEISQALASLLPAARQETAKQISQTSLRQVAPAMLNWKKSIQIAQTDISALKEATLVALKSDEEQFDDDEIADVAEQLDKFDAIPDFLARALADLADDMVNSEGDAREDALTAMRDEIKDLRDFLKTDEFVTVLPDAGVYTVSFIDTCQAALDELEDALSN
jgi:hypothetical protein